MTSILEKLDEKRVFYIEKLGDKFEIIECCDNYFSLVITREEMLKLSEEIKKLAEGE